MEHKLKKYVQITILTKITYPKLGNFVILVKKDH